MKAPLLTLALLLLSGAALASSTLRCGKGLVSADDSGAEVESKCGTPVSRSMLGNKVIYGYYGERSEVQVEEWTYGPRNGMFYFLRFEGDRLVNVDSKRGG
ncbi:MAG: DUF2845 domain-containing protein [Pseudomonas sp.]|uniref:DUF2845 domain-containing protein n=1 Tax=Pseudomonas sp. TaxID=306 RepID=UPI0030F282CC